MQLGGIRYLLLAFVAAFAAVTPDLSSSWRASAQTTSAQGGTASRTVLAPNAVPGAGSVVPTADQQNPPGINDPIFFRGRVVSDDGSALGNNTTIETVCNGSNRIETYVDSKGRFSFQFGQAGPEVVQDASIAGGDRLQTSRAGSRRWELTNCQLQARVPGFLSESVRLPPDGQNVGTIIVHRLGVVEGGVVSAVVLAAPKDARKAFDKGEDDLKKGSTEQARKSFEKAVGLYPQYATAWQELGKLQFGAHQEDQARDSFAAAIKADPKFIEPYLGLAAIQANGREWGGLLVTTNRTLQLDPYDYPQAYFLNAVADFNLQDMDAAEKRAREAEKLDAHGRIPGIRRLLSTILLNRQDYAQAADQMRGYLRYAPESPTADEVRAELSAIESATAQSPQSPRN
jgi:tetratricopeptide (TPR) repeat protein